MSQQSSIDSTIDHLFPLPHEKSPTPISRMTVGARIFAREALAVVPPGEDQRAALRKMREALMTAIQGIELGGISDVDEWEMAHGRGEE